MEHHALHRSSIDKKRHWHRMISACNSSHSKMTNISPNPVITETNFPGLSVLFRGKVRDIYQADGKLLLVATDRISAFDSVLPTGIPHKGAVLTQLSTFWFDFLKDVIRNHYISGAPDDYPEAFQPYRDILAKRSMLVKAVRAIPVECVVRGYISGSGWKEYKTSGAVCGNPLPQGLRESDRLSEPIFTPSTKAQTGHDENISLQQMSNQIGAALSEQLRDVSIALYERAARHAEACGIILADTKFEFGQDDAGVLLIDEALTPDSSRFWPRDAYRPGGPQPSLDKQYVRDYLESIGWNKQPPAPPLPEEVVDQTSFKYLEIFRLLTGKQLI
jgi:phosphoribosylaminoimidazole-succinocarboxamide synthase